MEVSKEYVPNDVDLKMKELSKKLSEMYKENHEFTIKTFSEGHSTSYDSLYAMHSKKGHSCELSSQSNTTIVYKPDSKDDLEKAVYSALIFEIMEAESLLNGAQNILLPFCGYIYGVEETERIKLLSISIDDSSIVLDTNEYLNLFNKIKINHDGFYIIGDYKETDVPIKKRKENVISFKCEADFDREFV